MESPFSSFERLQNSNMLFGVKAHLHRRILDFNGDRVKLDEWQPVLKALSLDQSLHIIAIRSRHSKSSVLESVDSEAKARAVVRHPVLITRFILKRLTESLSSCLSNNELLTCIEFDGLLLTKEYLQILASGMKRNTSLQHISFHRCPIGDEGCQVICNCLCNMPSVLSFDLSGCNITSVGANFIARTLQHQYLYRNGENWKQSLRYRTPNTDIMPGLRRVTLNHNPSFGNAGVTSIVEVVKDDIWLKALDLQNTGISEEGGKLIYDLLCTNNCLALVDVRNNAGISHLLLTSIMEKLATNNMDKQPQYHWLTDDGLCLPRKPSLYLNNNSSNVTFQIPKTSKKKMANDGVRLTKSNELPMRMSHTSIIRKTKSACADFHILHSAKIGELLPRKSDAEKLAVNPRNSSGNHPYVLENTHNTAAQDRLIELSTQLEEESKKRQAAEKQSDLLLTELENHLRNLEQVEAALVGSVLVKEAFIQDVYKAVSTITQSGHQDLKTNEWINRKNSQPKESLMPSKPLKRNGKIENKILKASSANCNLNIHQRNGCTTSEKNKGGLEEKIEEIVRWASLLTNCQQTRNEVVSKLEQEADSIISEQKLMINDTLDRFERFQKREFDSSQKSPNLSIENNHLSTSGDDSWISISSSQEEETKSNTSIKNKKILIV